ncbi:MAG: UDP-glucose 4-epimerase GalE [Bacteriovoracia bacterium]
MKSILVTGGAGYIGSHTVKLLNEQGYEPVVLDNLIYGHAEIVQNVLHTSLIVGDISDKDLVKKVIDQFDIEAVMHFSAFAYVGESVQNPSKYYHNNVNGTLNLLDTMVECGVKKFIFSSTCATYGMVEQVPIKEDHPQNPINPYGKSKLMVEQILKDYDLAYNLKSVCFRYFNAAGADPSGKLGEKHNPETHLIPLVLDVALERRDEIKIFGDDYDTPDGTCIRDYIHVFDLAQAHILGLEYLNEKNYSDAFNLGNGKGYSVKEVIQTAQKVTGRPIKIEIANRRAGDPPKLIGSAEKAQKILKWKTKYSDLDLIIDHAWKWHRQEFS